MARSANIATFEIVFHPVKIQHWKYVRWTSSNLSNVCSQPTRYVWFSEKVILLIIDTLNNTIQQGTCNTGIISIHYYNIYIFIALCDYSESHSFILHYRCYTAFRCLSTCTLCNDNNVESNLI